jgi:hypothetical protein
LGYKRGSRNEERKLEEAFQWHEGRCINMKGAPLQVFVLYLLMRWWE